MASYRFQVRPTVDPDIVEIGLYLEHKSRVAVHNYGRDERDSPAVRSDLICRYILGERYSDLASLMKRELPHCPTPAHAALAAKKAWLRGERA